MDNSADSQLRQNLIVASAYFHAPPPKDVIRASCARVLRHALIAAGIWDARLDENAPGFFYGEEEALAKFPVVKLWYSTLIELTRHEPKTEQLLEGGGNLIDSAGAYFTACWFTPAGRIVAERLLQEQPTWNARLNTATT